MGRGVPLVLIYGPFKCMLGCDPRHALNVLG